MTELDAKIGRGVASVDELSNWIRSADGQNNLPFDELAQCIRQWAKGELANLPDDMLLDAIESTALTVFLSETNGARTLGTGALAEKVWDFIVARVASYSREQ